MENVCMVLNATVLAFGPSAAVGDEELHPDKLTISSAAAIGVKR